MAFTYILSDVHGFLETLKATMKMVDLSGKNRVIFLGDYIDLGPDSCGVLKYIKKLQDKYGEGVIVTLGNHEKMFIDFINSEDEIDWITQDKDFTTIKSFLTEEQLEDIEALVLKHKKALIKEKVKKYICSNHKELINWLMKLPYYYETETQIFVHAGVDEEAEDWWKYGTPEEIFLWKYPESIGSFYKDIIAGHISTAEIANDENFHDVFYDGVSHYYIDGDVNISNRIPVLKYDDITGKYYSLQESGKELCLQRLI